MTSENKSAMSISNIDNTLILNCQLWLSADCRDMQLRYQQLSNKDKTPVDHPTTAKLNRAYWRFSSGKEAFYIDNKGYETVKPGDAPGDAEDYVPIGGEMLRCAIANWVLGMELPDIQHVTIERFTCNAAAWVRLAPSTTFNNCLHSIRQGENPATSLQVQSVDYDENILAWH